jgi:thioredoxin reductase (NADPH)
MGDQWHQAAVQRLLIRYCPICDGFEASGRKIAVVGTGHHAISEANFISTYSSRITLIADQKGDLDALHMLPAQSIMIERRPLAKVDFAPHGGLHCWYAGAGEPEHFDVLYPALGSKFNTELAEQLGEPRMGTFWSMITR